MFEDSHKVDALRLKDEICKYVPIGFPDVVKLLVYLPHTLQHDTIKDVRDEL